MGNTVYQDSAPHQDGADGQSESLLLHYWYVFKKRIGVVAAFAGFLMLSVGIATSMSTPYYAATAVIEISPKADTPFEVDQVSEFVSATSSSELRNYYATQYKIMQSRSVLKRALQILREEHQVVELDSADKPVEAFRKLLTIQPIVETHLVNITFEHPDPAMASLYADTLARAYMESNLDRALQSTTDALAWLQLQKKDYREKKHLSDVAVHEYRAGADIVGLGERYSGGRRRLEGVQTAWSDATTEKIQLEAVHKELVQLAQKENWAPLAQHLAGTDVVLAALLQQHQALELERSGLAARVKGRHPDWVRVNAEMDSVAGQIRRKIDVVVAGEAASLELVSRREAALAKELEVAKAEVQELDRQMIDLKFLEGEAERNKQFYDSIDLRVSEVDLSQLMKNNNIRLIDAAVSTDNPVRPKLSVNLMMAMVLGLFGGTAVAFGLEYVDVTVKSREDIERVIGVPLLGVVPEIAELDLKALPTDVDRHLFVSARPRSAVAECLRSIRTNVIFRLPNKKVRTLLITSAAPREGKSFTSSNLSAIIAMTGSRVLLIDADLRRPSLHKRFGLTNDLGLTALLTAEHSFDQVVQKTHINDLDVVVAGPPPPNPGEMLGSGQMQRLVKSFRGYDFIIIDSPPVNVVADPLVLSSGVDGVLVVVEANRTRRTMVRQAGARLREMNAPVLGAVVNKLNMRTAGYGYNYYDTYGYYYTESEQTREPAAG
jgi:polysaccharide biosynthesis transport protein